MMKYNILAVFLFLGCITFAQDRQEREHRIQKSQFPDLASDFMTLGHKMKKVRYYKEVDSSKTTYAVKFKLDRLYYHIQYNTSGNLINSGFRIKEIDIPQETYTKIKTYISDAFKRFKIRRIWQEYPIDNNKIKNEALKNTFQNLLLASNEYRLLVRAKKQDKAEDYELWFDSEGDLKRIRTALPTNLDRVLY
ncbi:MAG: hypothetical protein QM485_11610 [Flavobacteriaceae bacterium]